MLLYPLVLLHIKEIQLMLLSTLDDKIDAYLEEHGHNPTQILLNDEDLTYYLRVLYTYFAEEGSAGVAKRAGTYRDIPTKRANVESVTLV